MKLGADFCRLVPGFFAYIAQDSHITSDRSNNIMSFDILIKDVI